jgi:regulatory protein
VVRDCLDDLEREGLLDDDEFARAWVRDRLRLKPRARSALLVELRRKGVEAKIAEAAVADVFGREDVREEDLVVEVALAWLRRQSARVREDLLAGTFSDERERARRRLVGYLGRRGFRGSTLYRGVEAAESAASNAPER